MRFPLSLTRSMAAYLLKKRLSGQGKFPLVLMLEPLHACNLTCTGCGRIREYAGTARRRLSIEECLDAVNQCDAPVVSVCGGEPLIYGDIEELVGQLVARRRHVYLCTNGLLLREKLAGFRPTSRLFINVHLDGMESTHDRAVERKGVFAEAVEGIKAAKAAGFLVTTNTTVYHQTDVNEIAVLLEYLTELGVDGFMISPAYGYESVCEANPDAAGQMFMTREQIEAKFREARRLLGGFKLITSPIYLEFLCGERELPCAAWANPTFNVCGWKGPCYLITDAHYPTYRQLLEATDWDALGPGRDPRCQHCLVHCGFEPAAVLAANWRLRDALRMAVWQMT
ncbi:MAG TPA: adenosyl-hopene transferase HpnH [Thermoguttaceae bacterium]|nr:adenosyl-hopene transferase HpnH [Thermoguttaceae bacterium]